MNLALRHSLAVTLGLALLAGCVQPTQILGPTAVTPPSQAGSTVGAQAPVPAVVAPEPVLFWAYATFRGKPIVNGEVAVFDAVTDAPIPLKKKITTDAKGRFGFLLTRLTPGRALRVVVRDGDRTFATLMAAAPVQSPGTYRVTSLPEESQDFLNEHSDTIENINALGGTGVIDEETLADAETAAEDTASTDAELGAGNDASGGTNTSQEACAPAAEGTSNAATSPVNLGDKAGTSTAATPTLALVDQDADGFSERVDCNDRDAKIHPGATEVRDAVDNDCNGQIDDVSLPTVQTTVKLSLDISVIGSSSSQSAFLTSFKNDLMSATKISADRIASVPISAGYSVLETGTANCGPSVKIVQGEVNAKTTVLTQFAAGGVELAGSSQNSNAAGKTMGDHISTINTTASNVQKTLDNNPQLSNDLVSNTNSNGKPTQSATLFKIAQESETTKTLDKANQQVVIQVNTTSSDERNNQQNDDQNKSIQFFGTNKNATLSGDQVNVFTSSGSQISNENLSNPNAFSDAGKGSSGVGSAPAPAPAPPPPPTIATINPNNGAVGTAITITGTNFRAKATVTVGGVPATGVTVVSATSITATVPQGLAPGPHNVVVTNEDLTTVNPPGVYTVPDPGGAGGAIDADGDGFTADQDCNDAATGTNPNATEIIGNFVDENCDGTAE